MPYHAPSLMVIVLVLSACAAPSRGDQAPQGSNKPTARPESQETAQSAPLPASTHAAPPKTAIIEPSNRTAPISQQTASWPPQLTPEPAEIPAVHLANRAPATHAPSIAPPRWDVAAYRRDPQTYLDEAFPGRANQTAQPAADVPFLLAEGPTGFRVVPMARVTLRARGEPWMPVTFTSLGLGTFLRNGLTTVSVPADVDGLAQATWVATAGTIGSVSILAGSPTRAGQVSYLIQIAE